MLTTNSFKCPSLIKPPQQTKCLCLQNDSALHISGTGSVFSQLPVQQGHAVQHLQCILLGCFYFFLWCCGFKDRSLNTHGGWCVLLRRLRGALKGVLV